jgi:predicted ester cyclase
LKVLTCIRVGNKQKKIDISIPKLDNFIHKVYINVARKVYTNVYLFEKPVTPLQQQRNNRELETIIQECIMIAIRESIPTEAIIRAYLDESVEQEEEVIIENIVEEAPENEEKTIDKDDNNETIRDEDEIPQVVPSIQNIDNEDVVTRLTFNDIDSVLDMETNAIKKIDAPKNLERLEEISTNRAIQRKLEEEEDDEDRIRIHGEQIDLSGFDILDEVSTPKVNQDVLLNDFEELF